MGKEKLMIKKEIDFERFDCLKKKLYNKWDIKKQYWYPLAETIIEDVISFDFKHVDLEEIIGYIKEILIKKEVNEIFEFWGNNEAYSFSDFNKSDDLFWRSNEYFFDCLNEGFWFSEKMDWIIYLTHEETVTFGGKWLIEEVQNKIGNWEEKLRWDSKKR